jgi:hypothetical protein
LTGITFVCKIIVENLALQAHLKHQRARISTISTPLAIALSAIIPVIIFAIIIEYHGAIASTSEAAKRSHSYPEDIQKLQRQKSQLESVIQAGEKRFFRTRRVRSQLSSHHATLKRTATEIEEKELERQKILLAARYDQIMSITFIAILFILSVLEMFCLAQIAGLKSLPREMDAFAPAVVCAGLITAIYFPMGRYISLTHYGSWVIDEAKSMKLLKFSTFLYLVAVVIVMAVPFTLGILRG